jgi:hypothetical protein
MVCRERESKRVREIERARVCASDGIERDRESA